MIRQKFIAASLYNLAILSFLAATCNATQQPRDGLGVPQSDTNTAVAPQQMRRAEPPPANASAPALEDTADALREQKSFIDALDYYQAAFGKGGNAAILHNKMGICYLQMLRYDQARKEFDHAVKLDKEYPEAFNNLGVVNYIQKKYRGAVKNYEKAIALRQNSASFHSNLGTAYFARKEYEKANQEYLRAMELDPDIFERRMTGGISAHLSSPEDRAHYDFVIAKMYAHLGNAERCLLYLKKAMEEGYPQIDSVFKDAEFASLRKDPRFTQLMAARPQAIPN
jgi:tetratricopeptide (TPR) repeat protein